MTTINSYNHTGKKCFNGEVTYTTLKLMLLNDSATFTASHTTLNSVTNTGAYQVSGNGWTAGGETLAGVAVTTINTNDVKLDANDVSVTASGGTIGPAYKAVVYDDTDANDAPLWFIDFEGAKQADTGTPFNINFDSNGLLTVAIP